MKKKILEKRKTIKNRHKDCNQNAKSIAFQTDFQCENKC